MINEHPNDLDIQRFILDKEKCETAIVEHIGQCPLCAKRAVEYSTLFKAIKLQERPAFDFPLADLVVAQLPQTRSRDSFDKLFVLIVAFAILSLIAAIIYLFKNVRLNLDMEMSAVSVALIIITILGIAAFLVTDMYRRYQKQMNSIA